MSLSSAGVTVTTLHETVKDARDPAHRPDSGWEGNDTERRIGMWSARVLLGIGVAYAVTMVTGFSSMGSLGKPLPDPYLAVAEALILVMAPVLVLLAAVVHACAPQRVRIFSVNAVGWMTAAAGFTMTVHVVELTVVRRIKSDALPGYQYLFGFRWPSLLYGIDVVAWDVFFALALLFMVPVFRACGNRALGNWLLSSGALSLIGIIGPAFNHIGLREIGIFGYAVIFPAACLGVSKVFRDTLHRRVAPATAPVADMHAGSTAEP
jgi:hypothetical protein